MIKKYLNGNDIKAIRKAMGLNQAQFSDLLSITHNYLSDLENNKKTPAGTLMTLLNIYYDKVEVGRNISTPSVNETQTTYGLASFGQAATDLREIFDSKNQTLITAIQANLSAFKVAAKAEKEKLKMADDIDEMKKSIKRLEEENKSLKGCAGGSPPLNLNPGKLNPTGTEDPET